VPSVLVLLSDGKSERGSDPVDVADQAKQLKIPIYTIALGTQNGVLNRNGKSIPVPPDNVTLRDIAETTGGRFFAAPSAARLEDIYANLGTRFSTKRVKQEITSAFAGAALVLLLAGAILSLLRTGRLP
jgi:Ca-activated chloride channel family protein